MTLNDHRISGKYTCANELSLTSSLQIWKMLTHSYCLCPVTKMYVSLVSMTDTEVRIHWPHYGGYFIIVNRRFCYFSIKT